MKRILLRVSYDGTAYHGWQEQPAAATVEGTLNRAVSALLKKEIHVIGASRTDAGVHAYDNVAVFDSELRIPVEKYAAALNTMLPDDIVIQDSYECPPDFHPRKHKCKKTYEYTILSRKTPLPELRNTAYFCYRDIDIEKMRQAAVYFKGRHDFKAFCSVNTSVQTTVRTIFDTSIQEEKLKCGGRLIIFRITGNGFLYNMVRIIAGTLVQTGTGQMPPEGVKEAILSKNRENAGPTAPPQGLRLVEIKYDKNSDRADENASGQHS